MPQLPLPDRQIVVLDSVVFRDLCYGAPGWVDAFADMATRGFEFGLADHLLAEVTEQWERGAFTNAQYRQAVERTERFISRQLPVIPCKFDMLGLCGYLEDDDQDEFDEDLSLAWLRQVWHLLSDAQSVNDLLAGREYEHEEHRYHIAVRPGAAEGALETERERWRDHIKSYDALPPESIAEHEVELLIGMRRSLDTKVELDPPLSVRLDLAVLHMYRQIRLRNQARGQYNPDSPRRRNDGVDFNMAYYLSIPAFLVTRDEVYVRAATDTGSYQAAWVFTPEEFADAWRCGNLPALVWPGPRDGR